MFLASTAARAQYFWSDPFGTDGKVAPAPGMRWESPDPLPIVPAPNQPEQPPGSGTLSLPDLTEFALRNNPKTRQAWFAARAAAAGVGIEEADSLPRITADYGRLRTRPISGTTGLIAPWMTRFGPSISLSYVLFDFGVGDNRLEAVEYRLLAANLNQNRVLQDVVFQVEQAYYRLIGVEALVRVNEQSLKNIQTALEASRRRRESGLATVADVYRAETQVAQAQLNLTRSRGEFEKARGQLATAVGLPVNRALSVQRLSAPSQVREITASLNDLLERAKASRPDLVAAEAQARAARATAKATSKAGLPSIEITGTAGHFLFTDNRPTASPWSLSTNLRIPLFSGFKDTYSVRLAEAQASQAEAARNALFRQTEFEVWQAYYDLQTATDGVTTTEAQVRSAEQTAVATLARYQAGFGSILDLLTAQQDETTAREQRIQSFLDWFTALARLSFSVGSSDLLTAAGEKK